jgi:hypothetical protein
MDRERPEAAESLFSTEGNKENKGSLSPELAGVFAALFPSVRLLCS